MPFIFEMIEIYSKTMTDSKTMTEINLFYMFIFILSIKYIYVYITYFNLSLYLNKTNANIAVNRGTGKVWLNQKRYHWVEISCDTRLYIINVLLS
jgi:hypothetical protein